MTFLALTVTPDRSKIVISQDQGIAPTKAHDTLPTADPYVAPGLGAAPVTPAELRGKILRKGSLVLAGLGAFGVLAIAADTIEAAGADTLDRALDIDFDFSTIPPSVLFLMGYSERLDRVAALMLSAPEYRPVEVPPGHTLHPVPCEDLPSYDRIYDLWTPAAHGEAVEAFHLAVAANVWQGWRERRLREPAAFGGALQTLTLTADGIVEREAAGFWQSGG
ncbi:MAG: hypothetical protein AB7I32_01085 [Gammaproteobacteria bacterium]